MPLQVFDDEIAAHMRTGFHVPVEIADRFGGQPGLTKITGNEYFHISWIFATVENAEMILVDGDGVPTAFAGFGIESLVGRPGFAIVGGLGISQATFAIAVVEPDEVEVSIAIRSDVNETMPIGAAVIGGIGAGSPGLALIAGDRCGKRTASESVGAGRHPDRDQMGAAGGNLGIHATAGGVGMRLIDINLHRFAPGVARVGSAEMEESGI